MFVGDDDSGQIARLLDQTLTSIDGVAFREATEALDGLSTEDPHFPYRLLSIASDEEKVEGEELQKWLNKVVPSEELAVFIKGKQAALLPARLAPVNIDQPSLYLSGQACGSVSINDSATPK